MKSIKSFAVLLISISLLAGACKKNLEKEFQNPDNYGETGNLFGGVWTNMLYSWKLYVQDYGEIWWDIQGSGCLGVRNYTQIAFRYIRNNDGRGYFTEYDDLSGVGGFGNDGQLRNNRLADYYTRLRGWAVIKDNISKVSGAELTDNKIYFSLATVLKDYQALRMVDFYNSIPYSEAFKGSEQVFFPKYDDPREIYVSVLDELKAISEALPEEYAAMSEVAKATFNTQDIAFEGNIEKWVQYVNAIRLRFAVRLSGVEESIAKTHIQDIVTKNNLPTTDMTWLFPNQLENDPFSGGTCVRGWKEGIFSTFIPNVIMRRMNRDHTLYQPGIDDPRLPVLACATKYSQFNATPQVGDFRGVSMDANANQPIHDGGERYQVGDPTQDLANAFINNAVSPYNYATFHRNLNFPNYMMSMAEVDLLLAEVALKNLATTPKTAGDYIKDAIVHSTPFWFAINESSTFARGTAILAARTMYPPRPSDADVNTYADSVRNRFNTRADMDDQMEILMQQKFIHLNLIDSYELWAELRRTRHPKLEPMSYLAKVLMKPLPERLRYPNSEQQTNADNYQLVKDQDNFTSPIFWVPPSLRTVVPYWNDSNFE